MTNFEKFITFTAVVHVRDENEFLRLMAYLKKQPLSYNVRFTNQTYDEVRSNGGIIEIPDGELAIEYQIGKGLTRGMVKGYTDYGCEVLTVDDLIEIGGVIVE